MSRPRFWRLGLEKHERDQLEKTPDVVDYMRMTKAGRTLEDIQDTFEFGVSDERNLTARERLRARSDLDKGPPRFVADTGGMISKSVEFLLDDIGSLPSLSTWEREFLMSIRDWLKSKHGLTTKQYSTLQSIIQKHTP